MTGPRAPVNKWNPALGGVPARSGPAPLPRPAPLLPPGAQLSRRKA